jgi:RNA polymerase sigma-70 factor (ECF subfamily)
MTLSDPSSTETAQEQTQILVCSLRAGDPGAGRLLESGFREALIRFCWGYLGNLDEAEDAVQEVCCKVLQATNIPDEFRAWLYKVARNQCLNALRDRAKRRRGGPLPAASQIDAALTGQLTGMVQDEMREKVAEFVATLSDEQREVLRLRYVENLSRGEIGEVLEIPESVVKSRLFEAMKRLRGIAGAQEP